VSRRARRTAWSIVTLVGLGTLVAACGGPASSASGAGSTTTSEPGHTVTVPTMDPGHVVLPVAGTSTTVPREVQARPINPVVDSGQQIVITAQGFEPARLYANDHVPVVWTNLSGTPQTVSFVAFPIRSAVIPVGGQFVWTPSGAALTMAYRSASGLHAILALQTP
jgi:hypothetical protein